MSSIISIKRLRVLCHIGVPDEERAHPQTLEISVSFPIPDCAHLAVKDDVQRSVDYNEVSKVIHTVAISRERNLIETLAADITERLLREYLLPYIDIEIRKFIMPDTEAIELRYRREGKV